MEVLQSLKNNFQENTVATIGTFDGVHIGHQEILKRIVKTAEVSNLKSIVLTFFPHPRMVLQKDANIKLINTIAERRNLLEKQGLDYLFVQPFTKAFSRLTAEDFVREILIKQLRVKKIIIGYDHHFGRNRNANIEDLKLFGKKYGFEVEEIPAQDIDEVSVSSTKIRNALLDGDMETANNYLGYHFSITGVVISGKGIGKTIGFPTANIQIDQEYKLIPKQGVYLVKWLNQNQTVFGLMNIGNNPTVNSSEKVFLEVHFLNFNKNIYGETIQLEFLYRLRDEVKFDSLDLLKEQIVKDKSCALEYIKQIK